MQTLNSRAGSLSLKQLSYLLAIERTLNFTRAAEECFVTQSTLSGGLAELERTLGLTLVERSRKHVSMTVAGLEVCRRARQMLSLSGDLFAFVDSVNDPGKGSMVLGVIPTIAPYWLPSFLRIAAQRLPEFEIQIRERQTASLLEQLKDGQLDAAVIALPFDVSGLKVVELFSEPLCLIAREEDPVCASGRPVRLGSVDSERLILLEQGHCLRDHSLALCSAAASENRKFEAASLNTLVQLADAGLGLALVPEMAVECGILDDTRLRAVQMAGKVPERTIALVMRASHPRADFYADSLPFRPEMSAKG